MSTHKLRVIPKLSPTKARIVLRTGDGEASSVLITSVGHLNYVCGSCGAILLKRVRAGQLGKGIVFHCNQCGSYNQLLEATCRGEKPGIN